MFEQSFRDRAMLATLLVVFGYSLWSTIARRSALTKIIGSLRRVEGGERYRKPRVGRSGPIARLARSLEGIFSKQEERLFAAQQDLERLEVVLGGMTEGVIAIDSRRRIIFVNSSAERLFQLGPDAVGRFVSEIIRNANFEEIIDSVFSGNAPFRREITFSNRGASLRTSSRIVAIQGTLTSKSELAGVILVMHDVTELRRLERMRQDFVANVSHELKTPLASIKAFTETLIDGAIHDEEVNLRFLKRIDEQADRLDRLIFDLLSLARLESGEDVFRHEPLKILGALRGCIEAHQDMAVAKSIDVSLDPGSLDDATFVAIDLEAFRQIFHNLIDNAIKYTGLAGRVQLSCMQNESCVVVSIRDNGSGIPRDDLPRIFERFYRVDRARSRELGGTGLGLSIVKHVLQSIGGQINVESRLGEGTCFRVSMPRQVVKPEARPLSDGLHENLTKS